MERGTILLGRYAFEIRLGESVRGETLAAREVSTGHLRIIKVLPSISDARGVAALRAKLDPARRAHAPALMKPLEVGLSTELEAACIVTEHVEGDPVQAPIEAHEAAEIARQIAAALRALHSAGLAHGALHERNVLLDRSGRVRLRDFALAEGTPEDDVRALGALVERWLPSDDETMPVMQVRAVCGLCARGATAAQVETALAPIARAAPARPSRATPIRPSDTHARPGVSEPATLVIRCRLPAALKFRTAGEQSWLADALGERARITLVDEEIVGMLETDLARAEELAKKIRLSLRARSPDAVVESVIRASAPMRTTMG